jgi:hypothetical protein
VNANEAPASAMERHLDWLLDEVLGVRPPPDATAAILARTAAARDAADAAGPRTPRWLAAALILSGSAAVLGVTWRARARPEAPAQAPRDERVWTEVHGPGALAALPAGVQHLKCFDMTDDGMAGLARLLALQSLDLSGADADETGTRVAVPLSGKGFVHLAGLRDLRWLSVDACNALAGGIQHLGNAPLLEHLDLTYTAANADDLARLQRLPSLRELSLAYCGSFPGSALAEVARCPGLRKLSLHGCWTLRSDDVPPLAQLRALRELDLGDCNGRFRGQVEGELPFRGDDLGLDDRAVRALGALQLESLTLSGSEHLTDAGIAELAGQQGLRRLSLEGLPLLTGACLPRLPRGLEVLHLAHSHAIATPALLGLAERRALRELSLPVGPALRDGDLATLVRSLPLRVLRLDGVEQDGKSIGAAPGVLTAAIAPILARAEGLEELQLAGLPCVDADVIAAAAALPRLTALDLSWNRQLRDADLRALGAARSLRSLRLGWCAQLTAAALEPLRALPLRELDLYGTAVARPELERLAASWPGCGIVLANSARLRVPAK